MDDIVAVIEQGRQMQFNRHAIVNDVVALGGDYGRAHSMDEKDLPLYLIGLLCRKVRGL